MDRRPFDLPTELLARWPALLAAAVIALACLGFASQSSGATDADAGETTAATAPGTSGADRTPAAAPDRAEVPAAPAAPVAHPVEAVLEEAAAAHDLDPALLKAIAWVESSWRPQVVSHAGAIGIMQLLPDTVDVAGRLLGRELDPHRVEDNVHGGAAYLAYLLRIADDVDLALAAYHQGWVSVREHGPSPASERYVAAVHQVAAVFRDAATS